MLKGGEITFHLLFKNSLFLSRIVINPTDTHPYINAITMIQDNIQKTQSIKVVSIKSKDNGNSIDHPLQEKLYIPTQEGSYLVNKSDVLRVEGSGNYTLVYFKNQKHILVSKTLKVIASKLSSQQFLRIHKSHLINIGEIAFIGNATLTLSDDTIIPISRSSKASLQALLRPLKY